MLAACDPSNGATSSYLVGSAAAAGRERDVDVEVLARALAHLMHQADVRGVVAVLVHADEQHLKGSPDEGRG